MLTVVGHLKNESVQRQRTPKIHSIHSTRGSGATDTTSRRRKQEGLSGVH